MFETVSGKLSAHRLSTCSVIRRTDELGKETPSLPSFFVKALSNGFSAGIVYATPTRSTVTRSSDCLSLSMMITCWVSWLQYGCFNAMTCVPANAFNNNPLPSIYHDNVTKTTTNKNESARTHSSVFAADVALFCYVSVRFCLLSVRSPNQRDLLPSNAHDCITV